MEGSGGEEQRTRPAAPVVLMVLAPGRARELGAALERRGARVVVSSMLRAAAEAARVSPKTVVVDEAVDVDGLRAELEEEPLTRGVEILVLGPDDREVDPSIVAERVIPARTIAAASEQEHRPLSLRAPPKPGPRNAPTKPLSLRAPPKPLSLRAPPKPFDLVRASRPPPLPPLPAPSSAAAEPKRKKRAPKPSVQPSESPGPVVGRPRETTASRSVWLLPVAALVAIGAFAWANRTPHAADQTAPVAPAVTEPVTLPAPKRPAATPTTAASTPRVPPAIPQARAARCDALNQNLPPAQGAYPGAALAKLALAREAKFRRSTKEAHQILCHALHLDPKNAAASAALASLLVDLGDAEQALAYAKVALSVPSPPADARLAATDALALSGRFESARAELERANAGATVTDELAKADDAIDPEQARRHALRALALDPGSEPAARALARSFEALSQPAAAKAWSDYAGGGAR